MTTTKYDPRILKAPHPVPGAPDNWKVIGIQYIATSLFFLLVGGLLAMIVRGELITPPADLVDPSVYNGLYTMHGTVMLFLFLFPILNGFNNLLIPTMIGAPDMAFPKLNAAAFWLVPVFAAVLMGSFFAPGGPASSGWWSYPPMSLQNPLGHFINGEFLLDHGRRQFRDDDHPHARSGHGLLQDADLRLDSLGRPDDSVGRPTGSDRRGCDAAL